MKVSERHTELKKGIFHIQKKFISFTGSKSNKKVTLNTRETNFVCTKPQKTKIKRNVKNCFRKIFSENSVYSESRIVSEKRMVASYSCETLLFLMKNEGGLCLRKRVFKTSYYPVKVLKRAFWSPPFSL